MMLIGPKKNHRWYLCGILLVFFSTFIKMNNHHVSYLVADFAFIFFLKNNIQSSRQFYSRLDSKLLLLFSLFNAYLIIRFIFDHEGYDMLQCFMNPFLIPSTLMLFFVYLEFNLNTFIYLTTKSTTGILLTVPLTLYHPAIGINLMQMILPFYIFNLLENGKWKRHLILIIYSSFASSLTCHF